MVEQVTFRDILNRYEFVLLDSSAFSPLNYLDHKINDSPEQTEIRLEQSRDSVDFLENLINIVPRGKIYVSSGVFEEMRRGREYPLSYKKIVKNPKFTNEQKRLARNYSKLIRGSRKLNNLLEEQGKVISLEGNFKYLKFKKTYRYYARRHGLSEADLDFYLCGRVLSLKNPTALISNDFGILRLWNLSFSKRQFQTDFAFYFRKENDIYVQAEMRNSKYTNKSVPAFSV